MISFNARQALLKKQSELLERLKKIEMDLKKEYSRDWEEQAQERENDEVLNGLAIEITAELARIRSALHKIGNDNCNERYGRCSKCGKAIDEQRLNIVADTELCINCARIAAPS